MKVKVRRSSERGVGQASWLKSFHTFSFADYYDPEHVGFQSLVVLNDDWVSPNHGFGKHRHKDMEIITYVLQGALRHEDSLGHTSVLKAGDVQVMSAGTGIFHSEVNPSSTETLHLLQIWITPNQLNLPPRYQEKHFDFRNSPDCLIPVLGPKEPLFVHQDVSLFCAYLTAGKTLSIPSQDNRHSWIQLIEGSFESCGETIQTGDALAISESATIEIKALADCHFLYFDLSSG